MFSEQLQLTADKGEYCVEPLHAKLLRIPPLSDAACNDILPR